MKRIGKITALLVALALLGFAGGGHALAGKGGGGHGGGGGGGPTPPGTIYFQLETDSTSVDRTYEMDADGGNVQLALPASMFGYPSTLRYSADGHRTWLMGLEDPDRKYDFVYHPDGTVTTDLPHRELFAVQVTPLGNDTFDVTAVRVCNSFGIFMFQAPPPSYVRGQFNGDQVDGTLDVQWSAEGFDAYAFGKGTDIRDAFSVDGNGVTSLDLRNGYNASSFSIVHLPTTDMTLGQAVEAGIAEATAVVDIVPGIFSPSNLDSHQVSPDGSLILSGLELKDSQSGAVLWSGPNGYEATRWSPNGDQVAFDDGTTIWLTDLGYSGGSPYLDTPYALYSVSGSRFTYASWPRWSPPADQVIFQQRAYKKGSYRYDILRIPTAGSGLTPVNMTAGLSNQRLYPVRWCADDIAP